MEFTLLESLTRIYIPDHIFGWVNLLLLIVILAVVLRKFGFQGPPHTGRYWIAAAGCVFLGGLFALVIGYRMPASSAYPIPNLPLEPQPLIIMVLSMLPVVLAAGYLGTGPTLVVSIVTGLAFAFWQTHQLQTVLEFALVGWLLSWSAWQNYRTKLFELLRRPFLASLLAAFLLIPVGAISAFLAVRGMLAVRLDYALTHTWPYLVMMAVQLLIAGLLVELLALAFRRKWGYQGALRLSPLETSLRAQYIFVIIPILLIMMFVLVVADWVVAGSAAKRMLYDRMSSAATVASEGLPFFFETGQSLIQAAAQPELIQADQSLTRDQLQNAMRSAPYFRLFYLFDRSGQPVTGHPYTDLGQIRLSQEEQVGITLALKGVPIQTQTLQPWPEEDSVQISFIANITDEEGQIAGVLLGRTDLNTNPFTLPAIQTLQGLGSLTGGGSILDENHLILYSTSPGSVMSEYSGKLPEGADTFFEATSPQGTQSFVLFQPVVGMPWLIVLHVPAEEAQAIALQIASPLLLLLLLLCLLAGVGIFIPLNRITASLKVLAGQAAVISRGQFGEPVRVVGEDEVGQLGRAFEQMRISLKARMEEMNRLLIVSQGIAANLEMESASKPILEAAKIDGAVFVRMVLIPEVELDAQAEGVVTYGLGKNYEAYEYIDEQLFDLLRSQDVFSVPNTYRVRRLTYPAGSPKPGSLIGVALKYENTFYGIIWVGFDQPRNFSEEEVRYLSLLAGQTAMASANSRLFASSEIGRQRLEAILASTPEPVLVSDEQNRLLLLNPAAMQIPGLLSAPTIGKPIEEVATSGDFAELFRSPLEKNMASREILLPNGKVLFATISAVTAAGQPVGRVCILRDITHYKELDLMKSEFVSTVSHDLRSPLTLMRGYATMLQMIGQMTEQQQGYITKILAGIDNMTRLVNNLLDLGRIESGVDLQLEQVLPAAVVEQAITSLQLQANQQKVSLTQEMPDGLMAAITADPALLQQALYNLIENAVKYTPVGGKVVVRLRKANGNVVFEVSDTGIGVAPIDLPRVFERFYRSGRRESYQQRGSGLGLAIVKSIAERHGGRVWVESQLGKGSTFYLSVPLVASGKKPEERQSS